MNILIWNSRGALKPSFQTDIHELARRHNPAILVVMETKLGGSKAKEVSDRLPFDGAILTETIGFTGGLWLLWNEDQVEIQELAKTEQEIHIEVKVRASNLSWIFSAIYASPRSEKGCILWNNLSKVADLHNKPWIMAGDFNKPLVQEDQFGGRGVSVNRSLAFKDCLDFCNMVDMGFSGPRYTWTNKQDINNLILERIDRFFMNPDWCVLYPEVKVSHLPRFHSDHCPVLMETCPGRAVRLNRDRNFAESIEVFAKEATIWNRDHFGNIHQKKRRILARIYGAQKALSISPSSSLISLESHLQKDLERDRNTSFYHVSALARRKRNHISSIKDERGLWLTEEREVMDHFRSGFVSLYTTSIEVVSQATSHDGSWQVLLPEQAKEAIGALVTPEEIKDALWSMKPFKAPGPDGLHAGFSPTLLACCWGFCQGGS
ncbi:uncharacterized protein LOC115980633 [Quercus lobata]|uniref:uncharacterized protein LOC115980633 n=1 Tax=Quercus lobata TaxID=97700 RepID=UPI0012473DDF|nr:uncharacterized protein LOC115980633 [Quercus lobata]